MKRVSVVSPVPSVCTIFNPASGSADDADALTALCERNGEFCKTGKITDAHDKAADAARDGVDILVVAGGDGTVSAAVSGLMRARDAGVETSPALLVVPLGTGNDLARTLGLPLDPVEALDLLNKPTKRRPLDVMRWRLDKGNDTDGGFAVNVLAGGFSSKIQSSLTPEMKSRWGPLAYMRAALSEAKRLQPHTLHLRIDDGEPMERIAWNVVIANARYAGGGISVAREADPSDGQLDLVLTTPGSLVDIAALSARLMVGEVEESELTEHHVGRKFELWAEPDLPFNVDGDIVGQGRLSVEIVSAALTAVVPVEPIEH